MVVAVSADQPGEALPRVATAQVALDFPGHEARKASVYAGDYAGSSLAVIPDITSDGIDDILVGAGRHNSDAGAAFVVSDSVSGTISLSSAMSTLLGTVEGDYAGSTVASAGDVDANGLADILVGATGEGSVPSPPSPTPDPEVFRTLCTGRI